MKTWFVVLLGISLVLFVYRSALESPLGFRETIQTNSEYALNVLREIGLPSVVHLHTGAKFEFPRQTRILLVVTNYSKEVISEEWYRRTGISNNLVEKFEDALGKDVMIDFLKNSRPSEIEYYTYDTSGGRVDFFVNQNSNFVVFEYYRSKESE